MTFVVRRTAGRNHYYVNLDIGPRHRIPGVTTIGKALANKKLETYASSATADFAVNNWEALSAEPPATRVRSIMAGRWGKRDEAGAIGTEVHRLGERLLVGEPVIIPKHLIGYVDSYVRFMEQSDIAVDHVEVACYSESDDFAGTIDLTGDLLLPDTPEWADVERDDEGRSYGLLDPKTGKGVYETAAFQIIAYAHSEWLIVKGATSKDRDAREEIATPKYDFGAALHIHPDGTPATLIRVDISDDAYAWWRVLRQAYELQQIGEEFLYPPTPYPAEPESRITPDNLPWPEVEQLADDDGIGPVDDGGAVFDQPATTSETETPA